MKFVLATDRISPRQQDAITTIVQARGWTFWHWFENLWLVDGVPSEWTAKDVFSLFSADATLNGSYLLVIRMGEPMTTGAGRPRSHGTG